MMLVRNVGKIASLAVGLLAFAATPAVSASSFQPHRAVYDIALDETEERANIVGAEGRLVIETGGNACDGYTVSQRLVVHFDRANGAGQTLDFRISTYEAGDGSIYRFVTRTYIDDNIIEDVKGTAQREDGKIKVTLENPDGKTVSFPKGILFPTQHLIAVLEAARGEQRFLASDVYEGSEKGETVDMTTAVIGSSQVAKTNEYLTGGIKRWPVSIAYFKKGEGKGGEVTPDFQTSFLLYENGVTRDIRLNYGEFSLNGEVETIEYLEPAGCERDGAT